MPNSEVNQILLEIINTDPSQTVRIVNAACRLVMAERERCALVAENAAILGHNVQEPTCREIARKIREG